MTAPVAKRSPWFWILVVGGGACALCSAGTVGLLALGVLAGDDTPTRASSSAPAAATGGGGEWLPMAEVSRSDGLSRALPGGRWVYLSGASIDRQVIDYGASALVETSTTGTRHVLTFDEDGTYRWDWAHASNYMYHSASWGFEKGDWSLEGTTLTLKPSSQQVTFTANDQREEKEDVDLTPRRYRVVDIELETVAAAGAAPAHRPGVELSGPKLPFSVDSPDAISWDLQRL
jgi:hypothetical protein